MNPVVFAIAVPAAFVAGVVFHKYVVSEAAAIKQHITATEERIRTDVANALKDWPKKL
jgi:hypothetical protein